MVFSSLTFLFVFLPVVLIVNYLLPKKVKNVFLLFANLVFYAYGEPVYVLLMIVSVAVNYFSGFLIEKSASDIKRKLILGISITLNIGTLCFFKYTVFFADVLRQIPVFSGIPELRIALPIGISFYTFQAVSYLIDVYRRECSGNGSFVNFAAYISLFPQLIAGPIVRYSDVERQLTDRKETIDIFNTGIRLFVIGLAKKVLLANRFGELWNMISANVASFGTIGAWIGAVAFSLQIYFDFAGYSDMARGLGKMLGFDFCINFNYPYISKSITEFWRRWHISLSTWFRDYVYIPLGGNRCTKARMCFNILTVWTLTGLWHGAGWNYLVWGLYYGIILLLEKIVYGSYLEKLPSVLRYIYTAVIVAVGWIFFANESFGSAFAYLEVMFTPSFADLRAVLPWIPTLIVGAASATPIFSMLWNRTKTKICLAYLEMFLCIAGLALCCASLVTESYNPFLYFRF